MMSLTYFRSVVYLSIGLALLLAAGNLDPNHSEQARAGVLRRTVSDEPVQNAYVPAAGPQTVGAQLYPAPRPVPANVGQTYITYPPLAPENFLYHHHELYKTQHPNAPTTRTRVHWR
jgi:hypothetical protein